jgi:hypothetical protein
MKLERYYVLAAVSDGLDLETQGNSLAELLDNAHLCTQTAEIGLYAYDDKVVRQAERLIAEAFLKGGNNGNN